MTALATPPELRAGAHQPGPLARARAQAFWAAEIADVLGAMPEAEQTGQAWLYVIQMGGSWIEPPDVAQAADLFCEFALCGISSGPCHTMPEAIATWIKATRRRAVEQDQF